MKHRDRIIVGAIAWLLFAAGNSYAGDARHAAGTLDSLERFLAEGTPGGLQHAEESVNPIENDLEGLDPAVKAPLLARLNEDKKKITAALFAKDKGLYATRIERTMQRARDLVAPDKQNVSAAFAPTHEDLEHAEKEIAAPEAAKFLAPATRKQYADELLVIRGKLAEKYMKQNLDHTASRVESIEGKLPDFLKGAKEAETNQNPAALDSTARSFGADIGMVRKSILAMPADNAAVKSLAQRVATVNDAFESTVARVQGPGVFTDFNGDWEVRLAPAMGWESETQAITLAQFLGEPGENTSALNMPKSLELLRTANGWLRKFYGFPYPATQGDSKESYRAFLRDAKVNALVEGVTKQRDAAETKLIASLTPLLDEAEKTKQPPEAIARFKTLLERTLPESLVESPRSKPLVERMKALIARE